MKNNYKALENAFNAALDQASTGKGKERHAVDNPIEEQPICAIQRLLYDHPFAGQAFQVIKKTIEAGRLFQTRGPDAAVSELYGSMVYLGAMVTLIKEKAGIATPHNENAILEGIYRKERIIPGMEGVDCLIPIDLPQAMKLEGIPEGQPMNIRLTAAKQNKETDHEQRPQTGT